RGTGRAAAGRDLGRAGGPGRDRGVLDAAGDDGGDQKSHHGGQREGDERESLHASGGPVRSWPFIISVANSASVSTSTPNCRAFSSWLPASSPATSSEVFLLTEPDTFAPSRSSASVA